MNKKKFPKKIYLLNNENLECLSDGTDWCVDSIFDDDVLYIKFDELIKIIKYQKINEYGSLIEGLCKKDQDYLLKKLGVDEE